MSDEKDTDKAPRKKSKLPLFLVMLLLLGGGGGGGAYFALAKKGGHGAKKKAAHDDEDEAERGAAEEEGEEGGKGEAKGHAKEMGPTLALESFLVNLAESEGTRYLKVTVEIELKKPLPEPMTKLVLKVRDKMIVYLSSLKVADMQKAETKELIRNELFKHSVEVYGKKYIRALYFKELVMQ
ncbi:MAG: flagellar basal body-associated FliL family protein [Deltaproteobacteria bacterium]|nr:flagellar basal body-associated FliL family protein [Deltaproteobacteria bacterium]